MCKNDLIVPCLLVDRLWQGFLYKEMINLDEIVKNIRIMYGYAKRPLGYAFSLLGYAKFR